MRQYQSWPGFDALSALLFGRPLSLKWTGPTSASDTVFERVQRLLQIYALVQDNEKEVGSLVTRREGRAMYEDLRRLSGELQSMSESFAEAAAEVHQLARTGKVTDEYKIRYESKLHW